MNVKFEIPEVTDKLKKAKPVVGLVVNCITAYGVGAFLGAWANVMSYKDPFTRFAVSLACSVLGAAAGTVAQQQTDEIFDSVIEATEVIVI